MGGAGCRGELCVWVGGKVSELRRGAAALQDGSAYVETFMAVLRNVTKEETVQYVLAHLDNIISGAPPARTGPLAQPARRAAGSDALTASCWADLDDIIIAAS